MSNNNHKYSAADYAHLLANRVYFSDFYSIMYIIMIILNLIIIVWMLMTPGGYDGNVTFLVLQITVNVVLVLEVTIRIISLNWNFFLYCSNIFDLCVMIVAIIAQILYIHPPEAAAAAVTTEEWEDIGATGFRIIRDGILFCRLYIFIRNRKKNQLDDEDDVDFSAIHEDQDHEVESVHTSLLNRL